MDPIIMRFVIGVTISATFGALAFMKEMVDDKGFLFGVILFTSIYVFLNWQSYIVIILFFFITAFCINLENNYKANKGEFELYKAKRTSSRVLGRSLAGAIFAALFFLTERPEFRLAFLASYAESVFDTVSTKTGKICSKDAVSILNFKVVHRGTPGGISLTGTFFGAAAALLLITVGVFTGLGAFNNLLVVLVAAFMGALVDSILNAIAYKKKRIPNDFINFSSSMFAGISCVLLQWICDVLLGLNW